MCCGNYVGKLFLVFGLACKRPTSRKCKHKPATYHQHQGQAQPITNHPKSRSGRGKKQPPLICCYQNPPKHHHPYHHNNNKIRDQRKIKSDKEKWGFGSS